MMLMLEMSEGMGRGQDVRGSLLLLLSGVKVECEPGGVGGVALHGGDVGGEGEGRGLRAWELAGLPVLPRPHFRRLANQAWRACRRCRKSFHKETER